MEPGNDDNRCIGLRQGQGLGISGGKRAYESRYDLSCTIRRARDVAEKVE